MNDQLNYSITDRSEKDLATMVKASTSTHPNVYLVYEEFGAGKIPSAEPTASPQTKGHDDLMFQSTNKMSSSSPMPPPNSALSNSDSSIKKKRANTSRTKASNSCHNCKATNSPLWRKDNEGRTLCNKWYVHPLISADLTSNHVIAVCT